MTDKYKITAHVDSENGFWAVIRTDWMCIAAYDTSDESSRGIATLSG